MAIDEADLAFAFRLADAAGAAILPYFRKKIAVTNKLADAFDPVTEADKGGEAAIRAILRAERPEDGILGEEYGEHQGASGRVWVLDPVDGTRAFIIGQLHWGTLIALNEDGYPRLGIIDQPATKERFWGMNGEAFLDGPAGREKLAVRPCADLKDAVVSSSHPWDHFVPENEAKFKALCRAARLSRFGGDCYAYGLLAMGLIDCVIEESMKPWDVQALIPVVEGAGGMVTDWSGNPCPHGGQVIACGDKRVHEQALKMMG